MSLPPRRPVERIDVHAHFVPDFYAKALIEAGKGKPDGMPAIPSWNENAALNLMDNLGVRTAMLSISTPGIHFGDDAKARRLARQVNDEASRLKKKYPGRFGFFASLPLPDIQGSLEEIKRAFDELDADGVVFLTNSQEIYLGNPILDPIFEELNKRKAVIFIHPTSPCHVPLSHFPNPMLEFQFEATRSIADMVTAGVLQRNPNVQVVVPHGGAALTIMADRIDLIGTLANTRAAGPGKPKPSMREAIKHLHFDLAGTPVPALLRELLEMADHDKIHYGSDFPFTPAPGCENLMVKLETTDLLTEEQRRKFMSENSAKLFPKLAKMGGSGSL